MSSLEKIQQKWFAVETESRRDERLSRISWIFLSVLSQQHAVVGYIDQILHMLPLLIWSSVLWMVANVFNFRIVCYSQCMKHINIQKSVRMGMVYILFWT
jgi:hypothetical protein